MTATSLPNDLPSHLEVAGDGGGAPALTQAERAARSLAEDRHGKEPLEVQLLAASLDEQAAIRFVVAQFVPKEADWCFLYLQDAQGLPRRVQVGHADPAQTALATRFRTLAPGPGWANVTTQAMRDRQPRLIQEVTPEVLRWASTDEAHFAALRTLDPRSLLVIPLLARDRVVGGITLMRCAGRLPFGEADVVAAGARVQALALVLDNARTVTQERAARREAEQLADLERHHRLSAERGLLRLRRLESLTISLSAPLSDETSARLAFEGGLALLEPRLGGVALERAGLLELVAAPGWPVEVQEKWRTIAADAPSLMAEAWRTQRPIWLSGPHELEERYAGTAELARSLGQAAWAALPIIADGQAVGALMLGFDKPRTFDDDERSYVSAIAALIGQAAVRARQRASE